jgi:hypothetical protein
MKSLLVIASLLLIGCGESDLIPEVGPECDSSYNEDIKIKGTRTTSHLITCIEAPDVIDLDKARVVYSLPLTGVKAGDLIGFAGYSEVTNDMSRPLMIAYYFVITDSPYATDGIEITRKKGINVTPGMHHGIVGQSNYYRAQENLDGLYINMVLYAASGEKLLFKESLKVEKYGEMQIEILNR